MAGLDWDKLQRRTEALSDMDKDDLKSLQELIANEPVFSDAW